MFIVETLFHGAVWENCWTDDSGSPLTFPSWEAAQAELTEHIRDCIYAVEAGDMIDAPSVTDFRIVKI
jgi:hypothetical protein